MDLKKKLFDQTGIESNIYWHLSVGSAPTATTVMVGPGPKQATYRPTA